MSLLLLTYIGSKQNHCENACGGGGGGGGRGGGGRGGVVGENDC